MCKQLDATPETQQATKRYIEEPDFITFATTYQTPATYIIKLTNLLHSAPSTIKSRQNTR